MLMQAGGTYEAVELWVICPHFFDVRIYISLYILNRALIEPPEDWSRSRAYCEVKLKFR